MATLRESINKFIEKTLAMEAPTDPRFQSQPYSENKEEEIAVKTEESEKSPDFSQQTSNKIVNRLKIRYAATRIKYSNARIKSRNFLSNISYTGINKNDFYNESFILNVYVLLAKNLNPFSLQRKISDKTKQKMVYMLWRECIPPEFYRYMCTDENFKYLNGGDVSQPGVLEIVGNFINQKKERIFECFKQTLPTTKTYFNMSIRMCSPKFIRPPKSAAST